MTYGYDPLSHLTKPTYGSGGQQLREYDASGNLTHNNGPWDEYPVVDPASNRITSMGPHVYTYDARGNRASYLFQYDASTATYAYDAFNRLKQYSRDVATSFGEPNGANGEVVYHPAGSWSYLYDAQDQRVGKSGPDGQTRYVYGEPGQLLAKYGPNGWKSYLWLGGQLLGVYSASAGLGYAHTDHLGRPELMTNGAQQAVWRAANYGFTRTVLQDTIGGLNLGFSGHGYREYDSRLGSYLESDPIGLRGGVNTYTYVNNRPVNAIDSLGLDELVITGGVKSYTNPFGHVANAVTGAGVFSYGNNTNLGSGVQAYIESRMASRKQVVTYIPTSPEQDAKTLAFYALHPGKNSVGTIDNCAARTSQALNAGGVPAPETHFPFALSSGVGDLPGTQQFFIPQGGPIPQALLNLLPSFEPHK